MFLTDYTYCILNEFKPENEHPRNSKTRYFHLPYLMLSGRNLIKGKLVIFNLISREPWLCDFIIFQAETLKKKLGVYVSNCLNHIS